MIGNAWMGRGPLQSRAVIFIFFVSLCLVAGCREEKNTYAPPPPPEVTVSLPEKRLVTHYEEFTGTTVAFKMVEVRARVEGILESMHFTPSSTVKKGQLLFIIDPKPLKAALNEAKADLDVKKAELELARAKLKRKDSAFQDRAVSEVEVLEARANRDEAKAEVEAAEAAVETARLNLSYTKVRAPIRGRISRNEVDIGNLVGAGGDNTLLTTIVNDDPIYAYFNVSERNYLRYRQISRKELASDVDERDSPVQMGVFTEEGYPHKGKMDFSENRLDPDTGTIQIRGVFPNRDHFLVGGLFARIRVPMGKPTESLLVENRAIGLDQRGRYLLTVNGQNKVVYKSIEVGDLVEGMRVITSGITEEDRVIINGIQRARPGIKVKVKTEASAKSKAKETK